MATESGETPPPKYSLFWASKKSSHLAPIFRSEQTYSQKEIEEILAEKKKHHPDFLYWTERDDVKVSKTTNEEIRELMVPGHSNEMLNFVDRMVPKFQRYCILWDTESFAASPEGFGAVGFVVLDLWTGEFLPDFDFFGSVEPEGIDQDTLEFWKKFPKTFEYLKEERRISLDVATDIWKYFHERVWKLVLDNNEKWCLWADNTDFDGMMINHFMTSKGFKPIRYLVNDEYGPVRDLHSFAMGLLVAHEKPGKVYDALYKMTKEVCKEKFPEEVSFGKHFYPGTATEYKPYDNDKIREHHPVVDARENGLLLLALVRAVAKYGCNVTDWLSGFQL